MAIKFTQCKKKKKKKKKKTKAWIDGKPKQWAEEGSGGFDDETQRNPELGSTMKPTKSRETQACRRWVSVEMEDQAEAWIGGLGLGSAQASDDEVGGGVGWRR